MMGKYDNVIELQKKCPCYESFLKLPRIVYQSYDII